MRRRNAENTRRNLEISRVREEVGLAGRSDYLRWVSQLARDKQTLLSAEASRRQAETELLRILHRPANQPFRTMEAGIDDPLALVANPRTQAFLDTPSKWATFMEYAVHTALQNAPEIKQAEARAHGPAARVELRPGAPSIYRTWRWCRMARSTPEKSGAGSLSVPGAPDDESWSVSLLATLPLLTGGQRGAERSQARHEVRASEADRASVMDGIEARTRLVLHRTASSWPAIDLSREAQAAADENLANVTEAYARGAVSVTDLIDAQETALICRPQRLGREVRLRDRFRPGAALDGRVRNPARPRIARGVVRARGNLVPRASPAVSFRKKEAWNAIQQ